jgi:hypothetical protein
MELAEQPVDGAEPTACECCGGTDGVRAVTYDAMVDGPGYALTELLCASCCREAA